MTFPNNLINFPTECEAQIEVEGDKLKVVANRSNGNKRDVFVLDTSTPMVTAVLNSMGWMKK